MSTCKIHFPLNEEVISVIYLADVLSIDRVTLLLLYQKYGRDLFYLVYMLSGKKVSVPQMNRLESIFKSSKDVYKSIQRDEISFLENKRDLQLSLSLKSLYDGEGLVFEYESEQDQDIEYETP